MQNRIKNLQTWILDRFSKTINIKQATDEQPLRAELFSADQLKLHAKFLADKHIVKSGKRREKLLGRLKQNEEILLLTKKRLNEAARAKRNVTPAGEWILDNYYLIEEQIRLAQKFLPKGYSLELPGLSNGPMSCYPRIYDIAMEIVSHGDGRLDIPGLKGFISVYQETKQLTLGELWGIPIMLRLALIENLRRVCVRMMKTQMDMDRADVWAKRILDVSAKDTNDVIRVIAALAKENPPMSDAFVSEFVRRLHARSTSLDLPLAWLEKKLSEQGENIDRLMHQTSSRQAENQLSIANTIESLRLLEGTDWHDFVEKLSVVDNILKEDPAGVYGRMSFETRDAYRHVIEKFARLSGITQEAVAHKAVLMAEQAADGTGITDITAHVGYYLADKGMEKFCHTLGIRVPLECYLQAKKTFISTVMYMGSIVLMTAAAASLGLYLAAGWGIQRRLDIVLLCLPLLFVSSQTAVALANWLATMIIKPVNLPRLDYSKGIPHQLHTLVVTPCMLDDEDAIGSLIDNMEVSYLSNAGDNIDYALLTDFTDAKHENMPGDGALLARAMEGIEQLNVKYQRKEGGIFHLLHRNRKWNPVENCWMGYERKRGKLAALNSLLRGGSIDIFGCVIGDPAGLRDVKYVITLDSDTRMPRDAVKDLVSIIEHPLNRPVYDEKKRRVTGGYGILQPRVENGYPGEDPSMFVKIFGGETGIDPYTRAVSDVYQDLFFEGSFIGKGLYDVDVFEKCLKNSFPENLILSHDMLEGCYVRSALVTDVQFHEKFPAGYIKDVNRRRRWIRGDWQIARWLFSKVPDFNRKNIGNPISLLSQWKILDNLRRSLVPASTVAVLLFGWNFPGAAFYMTAFVIGLAGLPVLLRTFIDFFSKPEGISFRAHIASITPSITVCALQFCLSFIFVLHEGCYSLAAAAKTFWRALVTHKKMLEWNTSADADARTNLAGYYRNMPAAPAFVLLYLLFGNGHTSFPAFFFLCVWMLSPAAAYIISRPLKKRDIRLPEQKLLFLRKTARKTWNFFEDLITAQDNWLPPDNYQEDPPGLLAHRTSPTNMGLSLLSNLAAYDFGYMSMGMMINRARKTLNTMNGLDKYRGHFYNWYNTETLQPLQPLYISSVDSGNLVGHLLVLRSGLNEMHGEKIVRAKIFEGLQDTLKVLEDCLMAESTRVTEKADAAAEKIREWISCTDKKLASCPRGLTEIHALMRGILADTAKILPAFEHKGFENTKKWGRIFESQCYDYIEDLTFIVPWITLEPEIPGMWEGGDQRQKERLALLRGELRHLESVPSLCDVARVESMMLPLISGILDGIGPDTDDPEKIKGWFLQLRTAINGAGTRAAERIAALEELSVLCTEMSNVEYEFLYDRPKRLLSIGYNINEHKKDASCYDLLASEARLCSYTAIAQGKMPQEHWFMLGRLLSKHGGDPVLVSWGGSMFEYLMPLIVMPNYKGSLLDRTYKEIVKRQIDYGKKNGVPWGISESGYNKLDTSMVYQYRSFGIPDAGFKRGLSEDLVIAPYASVMALMVEPEKACTNMERLEAWGFLGKYGFYEAIDYTPSRLVKDDTHAVVKSYMAHHQGMSFLSIAHLLLGKPMQRRFLADPIFKATELLLQERVPNYLPYLYDTEVTGTLEKVEQREALLRVFTNPDTYSPEIHLLSNGKYSVMVTNSGSGYSRWKDLAITRWREDAVLDDKGTFIYIRDAESGDFWSSAYQPVLKKPKKYEAVFSQSKAEFKRRDFYIDSHTEIAVSPEDDIELRRITLTNKSYVRRVIEVTSYTEAVLNYHDADISHPAFSNLFVETEIIDRYQAVICGRRPRSENDVFPRVLHLMAVHGRSDSAASYETDRMKFIGRYNTPANPAAMHDNGVLSGTQGAVLDPIMAIRCKIVLEPQETATVDYITGVCADSEEAHRLMEKYRDRNLADRVFELAWTHGQVSLQHINATEADAQIYGRMAGAVIYANTAWRANASVIKKNLRGQPDLWGYSISGDIPVVLVRIEDPDNINLVEDMIRAHSYWRMKGMRVDLVIWNEDYSVYRDEMSEKISVLISKNSPAMSNNTGGVFLRRADQISEEDRILMQAVARIIISDRGGTLAEQVERLVPPKISGPMLSVTKRFGPEKIDEGIGRREDLVYFNGFGGFTQDGREYVITTSEKNTTPMPWVNVLANKNFGTVISESGSAYTWSENAHEFRLTPWNNDPITDSCGEAIYIRDDDSGQFWSPTPLPAGGKTRYISRHGFGYTIFEHRENGIFSELTVFVSLEHTVKFSVLRIKNISGRKRSLSVASYNELVMGTRRDKYAMHIITEIDPKSGALFAYNHYNKDFPGRIVFFDTGETTRFITGDRLEFIGRNGTMASPAAMQRDRLSGKTGAGLDPCACMQVKLELNNWEEKEVTFTFGSGRSMDEARSILQRYNGSALVHKALENVWDYWKRSLGVVYVETPDRSLDFLVNGWLQYQVLSCRLWGRSGYYQSGGAYGFRDQLQDVMSLMHSHPGMARELLLSFASHQFVEGDVQHWWHPPSGRGVRTSCSDDYLWLPLVTSMYVDEIGDTGILDEKVSFIEGRQLKPGEESYYDMPAPTGAEGTLYEHCTAAVTRALRFGAHGLPLMGSGDWNDGMNRVGNEGKGESVWLAFFLHVVLESMAKIAKKRGDTDFAGECLKQAELLAENIEKNAWDGEWYLRAYFDNGQPLGSASNNECRIDSIPQSWAVISGAGDDDKARTAMEYVNRLLVDRKNSLIRLFDPPFDKNADNPGYIKGYVPGVRENGGQYTHAAVWTVMAFAILKESERAWQLLDIINPIKHSDTAQKCGVYKVEPFVMAADVYGSGPYAGRGGWTWYTGSASWMYQLIVKHLLGLNLKVNRLFIRPCLPSDWKSFRVHYRYRETFYHIDINRSGPQDNVLSVFVDGNMQQDMSIPLADDRVEHTVKVMIG
ncbi:MAG: cyclic beta 1-2 glucan synthetase [Spirochaetia bacterium]|nr:cyclic beta 1-2 glucan synthetase [Spirochaetia bacterium]